MHHYSDLDYSRSNHIIIILLSLYDLGPSTFILVGASLDQMKQTIRSSLTCIYDSTLHKIFKSLHYTGLMIFSSLYSFRPFSIPWTKTTQDQHLGPNTSDQLTWVKYLGPRNSLDQKLLVFQDIHTFPFVNMRVYVYGPFVQQTCVYMQLGQGEAVYTSLSSFFGV